MTQSIPYVWQFEYRKRTNTGCDTNTFCDWVGQFLTYLYWNWMSILTNSECDWWTAILQHNIRSNICIDKESYDKVEMIVKKIENNCFFILFIFFLNNSFPQAWQSTQLRGFPQWRQTLTMASRRMINRTGSIEYKYCDGNNSI